MADTTYQLNFTGDQINNLLTRINNLDTELDNYLLKNGGDMTGAINMNGQNISGLGEPTEDAHAAKKGYVDTAKAEANAYTDASVRKAAFWNLLDNSDFRNPVNWSGQTSWNSNGYIIDRWMIYSADETKRTVSLSDSGLTCEYGGVVRQIIPKNIVPYNLYEAAYTIAMWSADGTVTIKHTGMWTDSNGDYVVALDAGTWTHVAFYEGEYTAETLPEYHPKGYMVEALNCGTLHVTTTATLSTTWSGSSAPYTQVLSVAGILSTDTPHIMPVYSTTNSTAIAQKEAWACVSKAITSDGKITFTCFEDKPTTAIPIQIEVNR